MSKSTPLVSVIIPAYNKSNYTVKSVRSVLNQTYNNIEVIVVNDGSIDDTEILISNIKDKRIRLFNIKNRGACGARNYGIDKSSGKYLSFLDCDDTYCENKIEESIKFLERNNDYYFIYTNVNFIDENDTIVGKTPKFYNHPGSGFIANKLILCDYNITNSTLVMKKNCIKKIGYFDEKIFIPADREFLIRLSSDYKGYYIDSFTTNYRVFEETVYIKTDEALNEFIYMIKKFNNTKVIPNNKYYNKCISNVYYNFAKMYAYKKSIGKFRQLIFISLKSNFFDMKMFIKLSGFIVSYISPKIILKYFDNYNKF